MTRSGARLGAVQHPSLGARQLLGALILMMFLLAGCGTLPPREPLIATSALTNTQDTALARVAAASLGADAGTGRSGFRLLPNGDQGFDARIALAERAERWLDAQYYHLHADSAGATFLLALRDAAKRGVRVRLLVDDFYSADLYVLLAGLATDPNVEVRVFNPLHVRYGAPVQRMLLSPRAFAHVNHRMHNKLFVADNAVALYGGRNVADEYFSLHPGANFVDLDVISTGAVVPDLSASFDRYWNSEVVWNLEQLLHGEERRASAHERRVEFERLAAQLGSGLPLSVPARDPLGQTSVRQQLAEGQLSQHLGLAVVHDDPPEKANSPVVRNQASRAMRGLLDVIVNAREQVQIVSPYFLPAEVGMAIMREASKRGTRFAVITNSRGSTDEPLAHRTYSRFRMEMLTLGVQLHEFAPELGRRSGGFGNFGKTRLRMHAKATTVDERWLVVGSVNLDARSATLNTELAVIIDCPPLARQFMQLLQADAFASMYELRLSAGGNSLEWHSRNPDGSSKVQREEPHANVFQDIGLWLQSLIVPEEYL